MVDIVIKVQLYGNFHTADYHCAFAVTRWNGIRQSVPAFFPVKRESFQGRGGVSQPTTFMTVAGVNTDTRSPG